MAQGAHAVHAMHKDTPSPPAKQVTLSLTVSHHNYEAPEYPHL